MSRQRPPVRLVLDLPPTTAALIDVLAGLLAGGNCDLTPEEVIATCLRHVFVELYGGER